MEIMRRNRSSCSSIFSYSSDDHSSTYENSTWDEIGNGSSKNDVELNSLRVSIDRMGRHVPECVARLLEQYANRADFIDTHLIKQQFSPVITFPTDERKPLRDTADSRISWYDVLDQRRAALSSKGTVWTADSTTSIDFSEDSKSDDMIYSKGKKVGFPMPSPHLNSYQWVALLFVDISGFTALSRLLDVENLSQTINGYFNKLIGEVQNFGGDILKFAGDSFFACWSNDRAKDTDDLSDEVLKAAICGANIVRKFSNFRISPTVIPASERKNAFNLDVHCGLGVGNLACLHLGDNETRREFVFLGNPIEQTSKAEEIATHGELAASHEAIKLLSKTCEITRNVSRNGTTPSIIASGNKQFFKPTNNIDDLVSRMQTYHSSTGTLDSRKLLMQQLSLYVHPSARQEKDILKGSFRSKSIANAEIRSVYTMFIKLQVNANINGDLSDDVNLFLKLNDIMNITLQILGRYRGHLRQFIVDDKGVVMIATFGQRGASFPNMITDKGLPATIAIYDELKIDLDVDCKIGATFGKAYCGVIGGTRRHEFSILGPSINLAARLMCAKDNPGILVDDTVKKLASNRFKFIAHTPVIVKGYTQRVPIYELYSAIEYSFKKNEAFVGRRSELNKVVSLARHLVLHKANVGLSIIEAHSGLGKTSFLGHAINKIRKRASKFMNEIKIFKDTCKEGDRCVPFNVFRQIIMDLLSNMVCGKSDDDSSGSEASFAIEDLDQSQQGSFVENSNDLIYHSRLRKICEDLGYSETFADIVGEKILYIDFTFLDPSIKYTEKKELKPDEIVDFIVDVFLTCTKQIDFTLLAIDDIQWIDNLSWKVIEKLATRGKCLMIMCLSRPFEILEQNFIVEFLEKLKKNKEQLTQFTKTIKITLEPLTPNDIRMLVSKEMNCKVEFIDDSIVEHLCNQSGGMPYFVQEIVRVLKAEELLEWKQDRLLWCPTADIDNVRSYIVYIQFQLFKC